jgi:hypothetical protein
MTETAESSAGALPIPTEDSSDFANGLPASQRGGFAAIVRRIYGSDRRLQISLFVLMLLCYGTLLAISLRLARNDLMRLTFNSMLDHLLHGQFDVDPQIIGTNGYRFNGRVYAYFGIFPALLRLPLWLVGRLDLDITLWSCLAAVCLAGMAKARAVLLIRNHALQNSMTGWAIGLVLAYILLGGSEIGYLRVNVYQEVILWAAAFGAVFVYFGIKGLVSLEFGAKTLSAMALCVGLSLLTRASSSMGLMIAFVLLLILLAIAPGTKSVTQHRPILRRLAHSFTERRILFPLGILSTLLAAVGTENYFRSGNPAHFAPFTRFCVNCTSTPQMLFSKLANVHCIPFGLVYYFFPVWVLHGSNGHLLFESTQMRLFEDIELPPSSFFLTDLLPLCFIAFLAAALWKRRAGGLPPVRQWAAAIAAGLLAPCIFILALVWEAYRYRMEFYPEIDFLALLGLYFTVTDQAMLARFARLRRWMTAALAVSVLSSFMALALYDLSYMSPAQGSLRSGVVQFYSQSVAEHYHNVMSRHFGVH